MILAPELSFFCSRILHSFRGLRWVRAVSEPFSENDFHAPPKDNLGGHFGPEKKYLAPPQLIPHFAADTLPGLSAPPLPGDPPFWDFQEKPNLPPPGASDSPFPSPSRKIKHIRNVHQAMVFFFVNFLSSEVSKRGGASKSSYATDSGLFSAPFFLSPL